MWALAVPLVTLVLITQASAQAPPVVPYPRDYRTTLVKYAVVDSKWILRAICSEARTSTSCT